MAYSTKNLTKEYNKQNTITSIYYSLGVIQDQFRTIENILFATEHQAFTLPGGEKKDYIVSTLNDLHELIAEPIEFFELNNELRDLFVGRKQL